MRLVKDVGGAGCEVWEGSGCKEWGELNVKLVKDTDVGMRVTKDVGGARKRWEGLRSGGRGLEEVGGVGCEAT